MSSAILYVAIVAIWALVLVPRWLHQRHSTPRGLPLTEPDMTEEAGQRDSEDPGDAVPARKDDKRVSTATSTGHVPVTARHEDGPQAAPADGDTWRGSPAGRRAGILRARRRMLATLAGLTAVAAGLAGLHYAAFWVTAPPAIMLAAFLVLLRQAANTDAERVFRQAQAPPASSPAVAGLEPVPGNGPTADVIDISGRVADQVYDQYADAADRAVGD